MPAKPRVITIEEHYQDPDVARAYAPEDARQLPAIAERLNDLTGLRIKEMDEAGIDMQVLSHRGQGEDRRRQCGATAEAVIGM